MYVLGYDEIQKKNSVFFDRNTFFRNNDRYCNFLVVEITFLGM